MTEKEIREVLEDELMYCIDDYWRRKRNGWEHGAEEARHEAIQTLVCARRLNVLQDMEWDTCLSMLCFIGSAVPIGENGRR